MKYNFICWSPIYKQVLSGVRIYYEKTAFCFNHCNELVARFKIKIPSKNFHE